MKRRARLLQRDAGGLSRLKRSRAVEATGWRLEAGRRGGLAAVRIARHTYLHPPHGVHDLLYAVSRYDTAARTACLSLWYRVQHHNVRT